MESNQDVFISHSSVDSKLAYAMCDYLEEKGIRCWIAPRDVQGGTEYAEAIIMGIRSCKIMVVLFNKNANDSIYVKNEVERAFNYKSILIPFKLDQTIPSATLELFLGSVHSLDAAKGNPEDCFDLLYQNCVRVLGKKERVIEEKPVISSDEKKINRNIENATDNKVENSNPSTVQAIEDMPLGNISPLTGIEIKMSGFGLTSFFIRPTIEINGDKHKERCGTKFFPLSPGEFMVKISFPWLGKSECGAAEIKVAISEGQSREIFYKPSMIWGLYKCSLKMT
jgi:hypothetical protein